MNAKTEQFICPNCDSRNVITENREEQFRFRAGGVDYDVTATVPVRICRDCKEKFVDDEGAEARHAATCRAMKRLAPQQIIGLRNKLGLSRRALADLTGIGEASLARWEAGDLIQSDSNDTLLRLTELPNVIQHLSALKHVDIPTDNKFVLQQTNVSVVRVVRTSVRGDFSALGNISPAQERARDSFRLRLVGHA